MKWALITVLTVFLPPIGFPWLIYELWKEKVLKNDRTVLDQLTREVAADAEIKRQKDRLIKGKQEEEINELKESVAELEKLFRNHQLFDEVGFNQEADSIFVSGYYWTIKTYKQFCVEVDRISILELVEYWEVQIKDKLEKFDRELAFYKNTAEKTKSDILQDLMSGNPWHRVWDNFSPSDNSIQVSYKDGVWTLSWDCALTIFCSENWMSKNGPHFITFKSDEAAL